MRADRLVAIALLLQAHGQLTAPDLARRLEVSERTIRRDLDALLASGLPVYSQRGRRGGWALTEGYKVNLSALTDEEAQALFLVAGPGLVAGFGVEQGLTSAVRKLLAALPESTRMQAHQANRAVYIDPTWWGQDGDRPPKALAPLRAAVIAGLQTDLTYAKPDQKATVRRVHPYGLVSKGGVWYLLAGTDAGPRTFRVSRVVDTAPTTDPIERPDDFDLARMWNEINRDMPNWTDQIDVAFQVDADTVSSVTDAFGADYRLKPLDNAAGNAGEPCRFSAIFPSMTAAACELIYFGAGVRVLEPPALRDMLARIGRDLVTAYGPAT
jgi:predicted DNA-binding transcriptional regulator YafY